MILFDLSAAQPLLGGNHGGGEYTRAVFHRIVADGTKGQLLLLVDRRRDLPPDISDVISTQKLTCIMFESNGELQEIIDSGKVTRFYSALPYLYDQLDFKNVEVIFTVHGLRPIEMPTDSLEKYFAEDFSSIAKWVAKQLFTSLYKKTHIRKFQSLVSTKSPDVTIVVPSEYTRTALHKYLTIPDHVSIHVLYSPSTGVAEEDHSDQAGFHESGITKRKYFLIVSGSRWVKNSYRAFQAIQILADKNESIRDFDIVVTGGLPSRLRKRLNIRVNVLPYIDQRQLRALYENAYALIYPSLDEGFGYPPLEAMASGTPVISSDSCSLPEIAGDAPLYVSALDPAGIARCIQELVDDKKKWEDCQKRGYARWELVRARQFDDLNRLSDMIRNGARKD